MLSLCPYLRWPVLAVASQVCCPIALFWVSCHLARLALTPRKGPLVPGPRHDSLIFTQGRGIQLSGGCLGHQPRLEQAGKVAVQAGAWIWCRWCHHRVGSATLPPRHSSPGCRKPEYPTTHTVLPPHPPKLWSRTKNCLVNCFCAINHGKIFLKSNPSLKFLSRGINPEMGTRHDLSLFGV